MAILLKRARLLSATDRPDPTALSRRELFACEATLGWAFRTISLGESREDVSMTTSMKHEARACTCLYGVSNRGNHLDREWFARG